MYRSGLVDTLVTHAFMKGLGLTPLFRDRRGFMPPQLKTKTTLNSYLQFALVCYYMMKRANLKLSSPIRSKERGKKQDF